jgi:hypothetical protein
MKSKRRETIERDEFIALLDDSADTCIATVDMGSSMHVPGVLRDSVSAPCLPQLWSKNTQRRC